MKKPARVLCLMLLGSTSAFAQQGNTPAQAQAQQSDAMLNSDSAQIDDKLSAATASKTWAELWGYHNYQGNDSASNTIQARLYHSLPIGQAGVQGLARLDTSVNSNSGPNFNGGGGGQFNPGNTRLTLSANTPDVAKDLSFGGGFRTIIPTGYNNPAYSSAQWAMGPQLAATYAPKDAGAFSYFSPLVRYMMGFSPLSPNVTLMRSLELYPTLGFQLTSKLKLAVWDENGLTMNARNGKWFIPADAMITYSFTQHWGGSLGASLPLVNANFNYFWNTYGRIIYTF